MLIKHYLLILSVLMNINALSQDRKITGRILDSETQKPIKDASIVVFGTTYGTFSNQLGFFELTIDQSKNKTLIVSHIGFKTSEVLIPAEDRFKFFLDKEFILLNHVNLNFYPKNNLTEFKPNLSQDKRVNEFAPIESGALYLGGMDNFYDFVGNSLKSELAQVDKKGFNITFTINENGQADEILISDSTELIRASVARTFQKMPNWVPATQRQNYVPQYFILPIISIDIPNVKTLNLKDFYDFISNNIIYPAQARRVGIEGAVYVEFQVDNSGNVYTIKILEDIGANCGEEVRKIIAAMPTHLVKLLYDNTQFNKFILPVYFGLGVPFKSKQYTSNFDAVLLNEVAVTAIGVEREQRAVGNSFGKSQNSSIPNSITLGSPTYNHTYYSLAKALNKPETVKRLSLIDTNISSFPMELLSLSNLEYLDLGRNGLKNLPNEINLLNKLQELHLFENELQGLPPNFVNLKNLKTLGLASNQLTSFPLELVSLEKLEDLNLRDNQLTALPSEIGAMKNLKYISIENNNISSIPPEFYQLRKLKKIFIKGNPISTEDLEQLKRKFKTIDIVF